jgi:hypothetical protein
MRKEEQPGYLSRFCLQENKMSIIEQIVFLIMCSYKGAKGNFKTECQNAKRRLVLIILTKKEKDVENVKSMLPMACRL